MGKFWDKIWNKKKKVNYDGADEPLVPWQVQFIEDSNKIKKQIESSKKLMGIPKITVDSPIKIEDEGIGRIINYTGQINNGAGVTLTMKMMQDAMNRAAGITDYEPIESYTMTEKEFNKLGVIAFGENGISAYAYSKDNKMLYVLTSDRYPEFPLHLKYDKNTQALESRSMHRAASIFSFTALNDHVTIQESVKKKTSIWGFE